MFQVKINITLITLLIVVSATSDPGAQIPEEARYVANAELKKLSGFLRDNPRLSIFGGQVTNDNVDRAVLGNGFIRTRGFDPWAFMNIEPYQMADCALEHQYCFPVFIDEHFVGTLNVDDDKNNPGNYFGGTRTTGSLALDRIVELQTEFKTEDKYTLILMFIPPAGYIVIEQDGMAKFITRPPNRRRAASVDAELTEPLVHPIEPVSVVFPKLKEGVAVRYNMHDKSRDE
jgi:hypothetical protein